MFETNREKLFESRSDWRRMKNHRLAPRISLWPAHNEKQQHNISGSLLLMAIADNAMAKKRVIY